MALRVYIKRVGKQVRKDTDQETLLTAYESYMIKRRKTVGFFLNVLNNSCCYSEITGSKDNSLLKQNQLVLPKFLLTTPSLTLKIICWGWACSFVTQACNYNTERSKTNDFKSRKRAHKRMITERSPTQHQRQAMSVAVFSHQHPVLRNCIKYFTVSILWQGRKA